MATEADLQKLVIQLEASFVKYERQWSKAMGVTDTNIRKAQQKFEGLGTSTARALDPVAGQTANIAAQFQDIAVQLQGGQSPFLIAMQQGTQLSAVLSQSKSPIAALSGAFLQLVNPISLATIAAIALGGAAVQWLTRTEDKAEAAKDAFDGHVQRIKEITRGYDEAEKAANDYIEQNRRLPQEVASSDLQREQEAAYSRLASVVKELSDKQVELNDHINYFRDTKLDATILQQFEALASVVEEAGLSSESSQAEINALLATLRRIGDTTAEPDLRRIIDEMEALLVQASDARVEVGSLGNALNKLPKKIAIRLNVATNAADAFQQLRDLAPELRDATTVAREEAISLADRASSGAQSIAEGMAIAAQLEQTLAAIDEQERRNQDKGGRGAERAAERERDAVIELLAELEHEQALLGLTEQQKAVANALRQAGASATDAQRVAIENLVNATYEEQAALDATNEQMREFQEIASTALKSFISDVMAGKDATEALGNALNNIGNRLLNAGIDGLFAGIFGGSGGGGGGNIFGSLFGGGKAMGGPVQAGRIYKVNENTPNSEYWMPTSDGVVIPRLPKSAGSGSGPAVSIGDVVIHGNADAMTVQQLRQWSRFELPGIIRLHSSSSIPVNG